MSQYRKPNPKSNWRRPKPKIYDCNKRDLENLYQSSYGEYLSNKADIEARRLDREQRGDAEALARRFEQRRAASLSFGDDEPRRFFGNRDLPNGNSNHTESSFRSNVSSNDDGGRSFVRSSTSSSRQVSFNTSLNDADEETTGESRLARLRRLRQELGLPAEAGAADSSQTSKHSSTFESSRSTRTRRSPSESRSGETSRYRRETTTRSENVTRGSPSRNGYERKTYSSHTEGSTQNGLDDSSKSYSFKSRTAGNSDLDDSSKSYSFRSKAAGNSELDDSSKSYSFRSKAAGNSELDDMASFEASMASRSKTRKAVEKPSLDGLDLEYDDEALLADMRKKLPSSSEILERIKNMDMD